MPREGAGRWRESVGVGLRLVRRRPELGCVVGGVLLALLGDSWLPLVVGAGAVPLVGRRLAVRRRARERERRGEAVIALCGAVVGGLRAGKQPNEALLATAAGVEVAAAARFGGDVPGALRRAAGAPGAEGLRGVAACWQAAAEGGAGLAEGLDRVAVALRAEQRSRAELAAELAGPRSTAGLLAGLPLVGLLIGGAIGAEPLRVLLHTPVGLGCLVLGGLLEWGGMAWTGRIVRGAR